ncbi:MAG: zinc-ribbon domain-containing protein [Anaerolineales bacterium]|nr:zinc-ribbon domain-containing protein [Anaerolineales bacterium]
MDIGSILLLLALAILVGLYVSQPLFSRRSPAGNVQSSKLDHDISSLLAEKERILEALEELDNDHDLGKIPEEEYPLQRGEMVKRGADILRQLDSLQSEPLSGNKEAHIEAAIAARRTRSRQRLESEVARTDGTSDASGKAGDEMVKETSEPDDDLEMRIASRRRDRKSKSRGFCPQCGNPLHTSDKFCPKCGKQVA